jgi:hypothetical protein
MRPILRALFYAVAYAAALLAVAIPLLVPGHGVALLAIAPLGVIIPQRLANAILFMTGSVYVGGARAALDFGNIAAGLQARLTIPVTGALLGDFVRGAPETDLEAGLEYTCYVSAADTVTVTVSNNTAGAIDPASNTYRVGVTREGRR